MPLDPKLLRRLFAGGAVLALLVVAAFYIYGIWQAKQEVRVIPKDIPSNVSRSAKGFTYSKSQGGKTLFTVRAESYEEYKQGGKAALHNVSIIVYADQNRTDQIYGSDFEYDPASGDVAAQGEVHIDLESTSTEAPHADQAPPDEMKNLIHLQTSGVTFNVKSGIAQTAKRIEFRIPEASGSAVGAYYDSRHTQLQLKSDVRLETTGQRKAVITSKTADVTRDPRRIILHAARVQEPPRTLEAETVTVVLRDDNTVDKVLGAGGVHVMESGARALDVSAPRAELDMGARDQARSAVLSGGVVFRATGTDQAHANAGKLTLFFGPQGQLARVHAEDAVQLQQGPANKLVQLQAPAVDLAVKEGRRLQTATTRGASQIVMIEPQKKTTITAGQFDAQFNERNRFRSLHGSPDAKVVFSEPGKQDQVTTSNEFNVTFGPQGAISALDQTGQFRFQQGQRTATAEHAHYNAGTEDIALTGSPRISDAGAALTADAVHINRKTQALTAQHNVKTTYNQLKAQPSGGMLGSSDPIHVTGSSVSSTRSVARFTDARLWQGENIVEAPVMVFDRDRRTIQAEAGPSGRVSSVFVQTDKSGKQLPVTVTADKLSYADAERRAVFSGNVIIEGQEMTMNAANIQIFLLPRRTQSTSQLDRIVAQGDIKVKMGQRVASGDRLVYTARDEKFVLTATGGRLPSIFDAEHGKITGNSLTFFVHDDRVLVDSRESSQVLTPIKVRGASEK